MNRRGFLKVATFLPLGAIMKPKYFKFKTDVQQIVVIGEVRERPKKRADGVVIFMIRVVEKAKSQGAIIDKDVWFTIYAQPALADNDFRNLRKGTMVKVVGRLKSDQHGNCRIRASQGTVPVARFKIKASEVEF